MEPIVEAILESLKRKDERYLAFEEFNSNRFEVKTEQNEELGHRTFFRFDICGDTVRFEIKYIFGVLDYVHYNEYGDVLELLRENNDTFASSSAYLALIENQGDYVASLQTCRTFLAKWDPDDIAEMIHLANYDIRMSPYFLYEFDKPVAPAIKVFGPQGQK
jgi:hypothetical protein